MSPARQRLFGAIAFASGLVFALGLGLGGMLQPSKVLAFLDFTGNWDPSLAFVMAGAIGVHFVFARAPLRRDRPVVGTEFAMPLETRVTGQLAFGAALFGAGWGTAGYCPGPALVSVVSCAPSALVFTGSMIVSIFAARRVRTMLGGSTPLATKTSSVDAA